MKTVTYHGPPLPSLTRMVNDDEPEPPQGGKTYPVSEEAMANLRRVLASQPPKPQPRGYRKRQQNNVLSNLLRRQREKNAERAAGKKKREAQEVGELAARIMGRAQERRKMGPEAAVTETAGRSKEKNVRGKRFSDEEWREYYELYIAEEEMTLEDVAAAMGNTQSSVSKNFRRLGLPPKRKGNGAILVSANDEGPETAAGEVSWHQYITDGTEATPEIEVETEPEPEAIPKMHPGHPDYDTWRRQGAETAALPTFWEPPQPVTAATNGTADHVGAQTIAPSLLAELARLVESGRVTGRVSIQLDLNFELGGE